MAAEVATNTAQVMGDVEGAVQWAGVVAEELESVLLAVQWVFDPVTAWKEERYTNLCTDLVEALSEAIVPRTLRGEGEVRLAEAEVGMTAAAGKKHLAVMVVVQRKVGVVAVEVAEVMEGLTEVQTTAGVVEAVRLVAAEVRPMEAEAAEGRQKVVEVVEVPKLVVGEAEARS